MQWVQRGSLHTYSGCYGWAPKYARIRQHTTAFSCKPFVALWLVDVIQVEATWKCFDTRLHSRSAMCGSTVGTSTDAAAATGGR